MSLFRSLVLRASHLTVVKRAITSSQALRPMVARFIAGETAEEAVPVAEGLVRRGFLVSLDMLGENVLSVEEASSDLGAYQHLAELIMASNEAASINISIKLTALGLDQGDDVAERNLRSLLATCAQNDMFVRADMEGSAYTERTLAMVERVYPDCGNIGTVVQSYLHRTDSDLLRLLLLGCRLRLVKGAYLEPADIAYQDKAEVDSQYVAQAKKLLVSGGYHALATHDHLIVDELREFVAASGVGKETFEWQMLYGIRRDLQESLLADGYRVRVYVPFGRSWYPYFSRRLAERPQNLGFVLRAAFGR